MAKIAIILWNVWTHRNHVLFRKIKSNPFLIIEKDTLTSQNFQECMSDNIPGRVENLIRWILFIKGKFKLNFDGSRIEDVSV